MLRIALLGLGLLFVSSTALAAPKIGEDQWRTVFGAKADGPVPTLIKGFSRDMSPGDAGKVFKGADKPSKFGFAKLSVPKTAGVKKMEIYFMKDEETKKVPSLLRSVTLVLDGAVMKDKPSYEAMLKVLVEKFGPLPKSADVDNYKITWALGGGKTAQVWKIGRDLTFKYSF